jgi:hypothetical protein
MEGQSGRRKVRVEEGDETRSEWKRGTTEGQSGRGGRSKVRVEESKSSGIDENAKYAWLGGDPSEASDQNERA